MRVLRSKYRCLIASFIINKKLLPHDVSETALPSSDPINPPVWAKKKRFFFHKLQFQTKKNADSEFHSVSHRQLVSLDKIPQMILQGGPKTTRNL